MGQIKQDPRPARTEREGLTRAANVQDKMYTGSNAIPSVWDLGLGLFFHHVILYSTDPKPKPKPAAAPSRTSSSAALVPPVAFPTEDRSTVAHHLITTLLSVIRIEREGEVVSRHSIRSTIEILTELTDEGLVALPLTASVGTGSGTPVLGVGSGAGGGRNKTVMGPGIAGEQLSPYKTSFEVAFLTQTKEFYTRESAALLLSCDAPSFLQKVGFGPPPLSSSPTLTWSYAKQISRRLEEEATRAQSYLPPSTEPLLIKLLENTLIRAPLSAILDHPASGLATLIADSRIEDLRRLYTLFGRVEAGRPALQTGIAGWIVSTGKQVNDGLLLVGGEEEDVVEVDPKGKGKAKAKEGAPVKKAPGEGAVGAKTKAALTWVQNVLDLKDKFDRLLAEAFASDKAMEKSINDVRRRVLPFWCFVVG